MDGDNMKDLQKLEQGRAMIVDHLPPLWRGLYEGLQKEGFDQVLSFELLKTYILSNNIKYER